MIFLKKLGFKINEHNKICKNENELVDYWIYWSNNRKNLDYDIDEIHKKLKTSIDNQI